MDVDLDNKEETAAAFLQMQMQIIDQGYTIKALETELNARSQLAFERLVTINRLSAVIEGRADQPQGLPAQPGG